MVEDIQSCELSFYNCVTMGLESSVHSACSMLLHMYLEQRWNLHYVVTRPIQDMS